MSEMKIHNLWPINVGEFHNPEHQTIKKDLIDFFNEYEKNKLPEGNLQLSDKDYVGNHNLYQSNYYLHAEKNEPLQKVLQFIAKSILSLGKLTNQKRVDQLPTDQRYNVNIKQSWFIRYNKGGVVFPHYHPECSWACVYYVQIGNEAKIKNGSTFFLRPYSYAGSDFGSKYLRNDTNVFNAEEGKLLIWPSFLYHGSHPYDGEKDRIIISANCTIDLLNQSNK